MSCNNKEFIADYKLFPVNCDYDETFMLVLVIMPVQIKQLCTYSCIAHVQ